MKAVGSPEKGVQGRIGFYSSKKNIFMSGIFKTVIQSSINRVCVVFCSMSHQYKCSVRIHVPEFICNYPDDRLVIFFCCEKRISENNTGKTVTKRKRISFHLIIFDTVDHMSRLYDHIGDTIQFAGEEVEITCALSQGLFGDDLIIICSQETFDRIMGDTKYGLIGIQLDSNATEETIAEIRSLENDDIIITDQREGNKQNNATYWAARIVCYGFLAIIGVISLFNIVNSISMSVSARIKQYGAMRAVGMDNRQLKRMISAEAYTYAISGLIVGCGIGLPLSRFLYNRLITHYFGIEWRFPILWFGIVVAFIFISAIVSVYAPAKRIRNMPITATINEL